MEVKTRYSVIEDLEGKIQKELFNIQEREVQQKQAEFSLAHRKKVDARFYEDTELEIETSKAALEELRVTSDKRIESLREAINAIKASGGAQKDE